MNLKDCLCGCIDTLAQVAGTGSVTPGSSRMGAHGNAAQGPTEQT